MGPAALSFFCGLASLSTEILWVRLYGFARLSTPAAFGFVLMAYLLGIAAGAAWGSRACRRWPEPEALWRWSALALLASGLAMLVLPQCFAWVAGLYLAALDVLLVATSSALLAAVFPIAHHLGADRQAGQQGRHFARVYAANVVGAALGPLLTGYVLLDWLSLQQAFVAIALAQLLVGGLLAWRVVATPAYARRACLVAVLAGVAIAVTLAQAPHGWIAQTSQGGIAPRTVLENRHGVIAVVDGGADGDLVYGGNVYDGRTNLDLVRNTNGLDRVALLGVLQPQPRRVLMVGLSVGTWLALVRQFPDVEHIDVVEINPGYLGLAQAYPAQARALEDARVRVIVDDARRWLRLHPQERYDLVVMNTTWHWRSNSSLILSREFMDLLRHHMAPGAVMAFNTTGSVDAFHTAAQVFAHAYRYKQFVYAADFDFRPRKTTAAMAALLAHLAVADPVFAAGGVDAQRFASQPFVRLDEAAAAAGRSPETVTDSNLITEFRYGRPVY